MIRHIEFEQIIPIWRTHLWPMRTSSIDTHSAMLLSGEYELKNFNYTATFLGYFIDDKLVGCNSGHKCCDGTYRSRGLYVFPEYRKLGIGTKLLLATIDQSRKEDATLCWSYPRLESWSTYKAAGFELISDWKDDETGINAYCQVV
jgi:GNAT superfamily N-acetyltransferase